jgi:outer membrane protein OmpA-like peptidoglycan-associated protein
MVTKQLLCAVIAILLLSCSKPVAVFHWNAREAALVRKSRSVAKSSWGYPKHKWYSYVICLNKNCITKAAWKTKQHHDRFRGFKNKKPPNTTPKMQESKTIVAMHTAVSKDTSALEVEKKLVLKDLLFKVNDTELNPVLTAPLDSLVQVLTRHPDLKIAIHGHTDPTGQESKNQELSKERAGVIAKYLIDRGIDKPRIHFQGLGSTQPIASNASAEGRSQNRRVEIVLYH